MRRSSVRDLVTTHLPGYRVRSARPAGEGVDNVAYQVSGELIVRFRTGDGVSVEAEAQLLGAAREMSPLPVPLPVLVAPERGCPAALRAAVDYFALRERAVFFARCRVFEDLRYGLSAGRDAYTRKGPTSLQWLSPAWMGQ